MLLTDTSDVYMRKTRNPDVNEEVFFKMQEADAKKQPGKPENVFLRLCVSKQYYHVFGFIN